MGDMVNSWIKHHRMLRMSVNANTYEAKKSNILSIYETALRGRSIPASPYVCNSHQADIRQIPSLNAIICDVHYFDIAKLVASSFYISPTHDIIRLADALLANSLLCHGKVNLSLEYAHKFLDGPYVTAFNAYADEDLMNRINASVQLQTSFAILHEIAHFEHDELLGILAGFLKEKLSDIADSQNKISNYLNGLNLGAITPFLGKIDIRSAFSFPAPENYSEIIFKGMQQMQMVLSQYGYLIPTPGLSGREREQMLAWACNNYLRGQKAQIIDKDVLVTEGTCDLLALFELLDFGIQGFNKAETLKLVIDAYALSLLTLDLIQGAMNALKYAKGAGYNYVDMIYMRREKEKALLPVVIAFYNLCFDECLPNEEVKMLCAHFSRSTKICDIMYAEFCEYVFSKDFEEDTFIPHGSPEWLEIYREINRLLQYPV